VGLERHILLRVVQAEAMLSRGQLLCLQLGAVVEERCERILLHACNKKYA
jgi:hypothetical protein